MDYEYYYQSSPTFDPITEPSGFLALGMVAIIIILVVSIGAYLLGCFLLSRIFKKAGVKALFAFIPIYNQWKLLEIGGQKGWWIFVPGANVIFPIIAAHNIGKSLGKSDIFTILYIFLPLIWVIILGFDKSQWNNNQTEGIMNVMGNQPVAQATAAQPDYSQPTTPTTQPETTNFSQPETVQPVEIEPAQTQAEEAPVLNTESFEQVNPTETTPGSEPVEPASTPITAPTDDNPNLN